MSPNFPLDAVSVTLALRVDKWLTSLGLSGFVAVCGYLGERGRESFLGLRLYDPEFSRYSDAFGAFVLDSATLVVSATQEHPLPTASVAIAGALVMVLLANAKQARAATVVVLLLSASYLAIRAGYLLIHVEVPTVALNGILVRNISLDSELADATGTAIVLRRFILCRHDQEKRLSCTDFERQGRAIERWYQDLLISEVALVFIAVVFWFSVMHTSKRVRVGRLWTVAGRLIAPMALGPVVITLLMLPYVHAKTLSPTTYPRVTIYYLAPDNVEKTMDAFVLHRNGTQLTLYQNISARQYALTELPVSRVLLVQSQPSTTTLDVLDEHIQKSNGGAKAPPASVFEQQGAQE